MGRMEHELICAACVALRWNLDLHGILVTSLHELLLLLLHVPVLFTLWSFRLLAEGALFLS
jgi:hypothetical protein